MGFQSLLSRRSGAAVLAAVAASACLASASGATGDAPTITVPGSCYVYWPTQGAQRIPISVHGLAANQDVKVELQIAGTTVSGIPQATADDTGALDTGLSNWTSGLSDGPSPARASKIVISDLASNAPLASIPIKISNVGIKIDSAKKSFLTKRQWIVSGLTPLGGSGAYYAFYFKGTKLMGKQKVGVPTDDCGYLNTKRLLVPFKTLGTFDLKVQASAKYDRNLPWIGGTVKQGARK